MSGVLGTVAAWRTVSALWRPYIDQLVAELDAIECDYVGLLVESTIRYVNPNRASGVYFVDAADHGMTAESTCR